MANYSDWDSYNASYRRKDAPDRWIKRPGEDELAYMHRLCQQGAGLMQMCGRYPNADPRELSEWMMSNGYDLNGKRNQK